MTVADLVVLWRADVATLRRHGAHASADVVEAHANALSDALRQEAAATVTLSDAARATGYSADHLGRLIGAGRIQNYGTRRRPRVRLADLPRKPAALHDHDARRAAAEVVALHHRGTT